MEGASIIMALVGGVSAVLSLGGMVVLARRN
jgi:hypothetical protein